MADKIRMPSGMGGLMRYFDDYKSKVEIQPAHMIALIILLAFALIILHVIF